MGQLIIRCVAQKRQVERYRQKGKCEKGKNGILGGIQVLYTAFRTNQQQDYNDFSTEWPPPKGIDTRYNFWGNKYLVNNITHK